MYFKSQEKILKKILRKNVITINEYKTIASSFLYDPRSKYRSFSKELKVFIMNQVISEREEIFNVLKNGFNSNYQEIISKLRDIIGFYDIHMKMNPDKISNIKIINKIKDTLDDSIYEYNDICHKFIFKINHDFLSFNDLLKKFKTNYIFDNYSEISKIFFDIRKLFEDLSDLIYRFRYYMQTTHPKFLREFYDVIEKRESEISYLLPKRDLIFEPISNNNDIVNEIETLYLN